MEWGLSGEKEGEGQRHVPELRGGRELMTEAHCG